MWFLVNQPNNYCCDSVTPLPTVNNDHQNTLMPLNIFPIPCFTIMTHLPCIRLFAHPKFEFQYLYILLEPCLLYCCAVHIV